MKKIKLLVATLAIAALAIGLCACSCSGSVGKTDFGWYKAAVPQGFTDVKDNPVWFVCPNWRVYNSII